MQSSADKPDHYRSSASYPKTLRYTTIIHIAEHKAKHPCTKYAQNQRNIQNIIIAKGNIAVGIAEIHEHNVELRINNIDSGGEGHGRKCSWVRGVQLVEHIHCGQFAADEHDAVEELGQVADIQRREPV